MRVYWFIERWVLVSINCLLLERVVLLLPVSTWGMLRWATHSWWLSRSSYLHFGCWHNGIQVFIALVFHSNVLQGFIILSLLSAFSPNFRRHNSIAWPKSVQYILFLWFIGPRLRNLLPPSFLFYCIISCHNCRFDFKQSLCPFRE
jgi:hypothetical protein